MIVPWCFIVGNTHLFLMMNQMQVKIGKHSFHSSDTRMKWEAQRKWQPMTSVRNIIMILSLSSSLFSLHFTCITTGMTSPLSSPSLSWTSKATRSSLLLIVLDLLSPSFASHTNNQILDSCFLLYFLAVFLSFSFFHSSFAGRRSCQSMHLPLPVLHDSTCGGKNRRHETLLFLFEWRYIHKKNSQERQEYICILLLYRLLLSFHSPDPFSLCCLHRFPLISSLFTPLPFMFANWIKRMEEGWRQHKYKHQKRKQGREMHRGEREMHTEKKERRPEEKSLPLMILMMMWVRKSDWRVNVRTRTSESQRIKNKEQCKERQSLRRLQRVSFDKDTFHESQARKERHPLLILLKTETQN